MLFACKEKIDLDVPGGSQKLVIEAEVSTETDSSYVKVTRTADYYSTESLPVVSNATVTINGTPFTYTSDGFYKGPVSYKGIPGTTYNLNVSVDGNTYTATSTLIRMYRIDSIFQTFKPASGFLESGWSVSYVGFDDRPKIQYTYAVLGYFDTLVKRDSMSKDKILFNSEQTPVGVPYNFEIPFARYQPGDECILVFRSIDKFMNDFIQAYNDQTSGAPGPFAVPPANLPTNITGGAIGYFATYDIVRKRYTVK